MIRYKSTGNKVLTLFIPAIAVLFIVWACTRYYPGDTTGAVFKFIVTESQRQYINESRGLQYEVTDPVPDLYFAGDKYKVDRFEIRGDNTLNYTRKSYGINMDRNLWLYDSGEKQYFECEEYKLLAMVYDYTYIENAVATTLFRKVGLWPVKSFFTKVYLNDHNQGLYFFIEDPSEYYIEKENAAVVIRRGYNHVIKNSDVNPDYQDEESNYYARFRRIYSLLPLYEGRQLYDTLSAYLDLEQYFSKISVDLLIKNGDYTDEILFYSKEMDGKNVFGVFPWDLDDIFADLPHEIGRDWGTGTVFGTRVYNSMDDVVNDVGDKLVFSIEDDLDYIIARDSVLYQEYLKTLRTVIETIDISTIDGIFDDTFLTIGAFYEDEEVISQSQYDEDATDYDLFVANLADKRTMLKERRDLILQALDIQQNR